MKTAVEWLEEQFKKVNHLTENEWIELFNKAKEMEKEQIIDFAKNFSDFNGLTFNEKEVSKEYLEKLYEQYYKENFKSE